MAYLNIFIGLGGTGVEVINDLLKIINRYPFLNNRYKCFALDSAELNERNFRSIFKHKEDTYINLGGFNSSKDTIRKIHRQYPESNITEIFGTNDYLATHDVSSHGGAWENRKLGFLIFINYLLTADNDIFRRIDDYLEMENNIGDTIKGINFFIINSLAGGTGSGIFFPFISYLKSSIDKGFLLRRPDFHVQYYNFLAFPDFLAKGPRKPSETKKIVYEANAYEALLEIRMLMDQKIDWRVSLSPTKEFDFSKQGTNFIRSFFLFNDVNTKRSSIPVNGLSDLDLYKPNFQEMAWCLYSLGCADHTFWDDAGNSLKQFVGMGILPIEFPADTLVNNISSKLFRKTPSCYLDFFKKSFNEIKNDLPTFHPSFLNYLNEAKTDLKSQLDDYKKELSIILEIDTLKKKEPLIKEYDIDFYRHKFQEELNNKIQDLLTKDYTIKDVYYFLKYFNETIKSENQNEKTLFSESYKRLNLFEEQYKKQKNDILGQKKEIKLKQMQSNLFSNVFEIKHLHKFLLLLDNISLEITKRMNYFERIRDVFISESKVSSFKIFYDYFSFPPPFSRIQYNSEQMNNIEFEILKGVLSGIGFKENIKADIDIIEKQLLKNIWIDFSKEKFNLFIISNYKNRFETYFEESHFNIDSVLSGEMYTMWYDYVRAYFSEKYRTVISKHSDIQPYISNGNIDNINLCYPYISLSTTKKEIGHSFIFLSNNNKSIKIKNKLTDTISPRPCETLQTDNLVMLSTLKGDVKYDDLELSALKRSYEILLKEDEINSKVVATNRRYVFIDPRFGENK
jgi:hypothetical protein